MSEDLKDKELYVENMTLKARLVVASNAIEKLKKSEAHFKHLWSDDERILSVMSQRVTHLEQIVRRLNK